MRFALIGCSAKKSNLNSELPAPKLYCGQLFKLALSYCESHKIPWRVLSSLYGLLHPTEEVRSYDLRIGQLRKCEREQWARKVLHKLIEFPERQCLFLAGNEYLKPLSQSLSLAGFTIEQPLKGLGIGSQMQWLKRNALESE